MSILKGKEVFVVKSFFLLFDGLPTGSNVEDKKIDVVTALKCSVVMGY